MDEIGLFDELFFAYFEDVDISWRANSLGYKNLYCPAAKCYHICGATTGAVRYNEFKSVQSGRNSILLPYKNMPLGMLLLNFIPLALGYLLKILVFGLRGFWTPYIKGAREAFRAIPKVKSRNSGGAICPITRSSSCGWRRMCSATSATASCGF